MPCLIVSFTYLALGNYHFSLADVNTQNFDLYEVPIPKKHENNNMTK